MTKPSTIAAIAVLVCIPALVSFASGGMAVTALGFWYLGTLILVAMGAHVLQWLFTTYSQQDDDEQGRG